MKRSGDTVKIGGGYQYKALTEGNSIQRMWHLSKQLAIEKLMPPEKGDSIVDVGCGSGVITSFLGEFDVTVLGIDGNPEAINFAVDRFAKNNVTFMLGLVDESFGEAESYDKIYCLEVIEHLPLYQGRNMLNVFYNLLKPEGKVFLTTPNYRSMWPIIERLMDKFHLTPTLKDHQHVEFYHSKKLSKLAIDCGFKIDTLTSNCFLSPWIAPISWKLAKRLSFLEMNMSICFGSVLLTVLSK